MHQGQVLRKTGQMSIVAIPILSILRGVRSANSSFKSKNACVFRHFCFSELSIKGRFRGSRTSSGKMKFLCGWSAVAIQANRPSFRRMFLVQKVSNPGSSAARIFFDSMALPQANGTADPHHESVVL